MIKSFEVIKNVRTYLPQSKQNISAWAITGAFMMPNYGLYSPTPAAQPITPTVTVAEYNTLITTNVSSIEVVDIRKSKLEAYLNKYKAPLAAEVDTLLAAADKYDLDWRLVAAISVIESQGGKRIPKGSFNAWGWGIPTGKSSGIAFKNWEHAIETISKGLKEKYVDKGLDTPEKMNKKYAASKVWGANVRKAMIKINPTEEIL
jgi:hypothetical protein